MNKQREAQDTFCWLIENGKQAGQGLAYRRMDQGLPVWTEDANKALWFVRREDAEAFAEEDREAERLAEHGFHEAPSKQAIAEQEQAQAPVAHVAEVHLSRYTLEWTNGPIPEGSPLYTSPRPRGWQELSDTEIVRFCTNWKLETFERDGELLGVGVVLYQELSAALRAKNEGKL